MVYQSGKAKRGEVWIAPVVTELKRIGGRLKWVAYVLIGIGTLGLVIIYEPLGEAEIKYSLNLKSQIPNHKQIPSSKIQIPKAPERPSWPVPDGNYSIFIPKIDAISRVIPNVNAADVKAYQEALKLGVAAVAGLSSPGQRGTTYLFSHSVENPINFARYNAVFYLLGKLTVGDDIQMVYQRKLFKYKVTQMEKLAPNDTRYLVPQEAEEKLILQTCWPPGTTWQRLYVTAKRVS
jgi:LPXTG-site transpeptidase (sortase) family protein